MQFLKPTRWKVVIAVVCFILIYMFMNTFYFYNYCDVITTFTLPTITPTPTPIPSLIQNIHNTIVNTYDMVESPCIVDADYAAIAGNIIYLLLVVTSYLVSCIIVYTSIKLKKS